MRVWAVLLLFYVFALALGLGVILLLRGASIV